MNAPLVVPLSPAQSSIAPAQLDSARKASQARGAKLVKCLEEECGMAAAEFTAALAAQLHLAALDMNALHAMSPRFDLLPYAEAQARECALVQTEGGDLVMVLADPFDVSLRAWAEHRVRQPYRRALAHGADLAAYLARQEDGMRAMDSIAMTGSSTARRSESVEDLSLKSISEDQSPVVKLVNSTLYDALKSGASDIHLETGAQGLVIKYRIDGVLSQVGAMQSTELAEQVISRIKVISELDIAERRVPQDGRFRVGAGGREIDVRVSIMPSIFGEDAVLRILDKQALTDQVKGLRLDLLGFDPTVVADLHRLSAEPYGMLLVTGPTGSGKTTTLYAAISEIDHGSDKIVTIEDPVEYQLPGVLQIPVNEKKGLTFARGLRSILRHDPDKIMVGEIRDAETAQIAVQAALTGHLVFTTVHANNVFDVLGRFNHMQVDPYSFVSALNGIVAQRLVRLNCAQCAVPAWPEPHELAAARVDAARAAGFDFHAGRGCGQCRGTGYRSRKAVAELLILTDELREMIAGREPIRRIKEAAQRNGTRFLREAALDLVARGDTTLAEINRVTVA
jgi:general secretion pathway protein E